MAGKIIQWDLMPSPSSIDRAKLLARCLNDANFTRQILQVFQEQAPQTMVKLREALEAGVIADVRRHAHTLKGSAGNLAASGLQAAAARVEAAAGEGNLAGIREALPDLENQFNLALQSAVAISTSLK